MGQKIFWRHSSNEGLVTGSQPGLCSGLLWLSTAKSSIVFWNSQHTVPLLNSLINITKFRFIFSYLQEPTPLKPLVVYSSRFLVWFYWKWNTKYLQTPGLHPIISKLLTSAKLQIPRIRNRFKMASNIFWKWRNCSRHSTSITGWVTPMMKCVLQFWKSCRISRDKARKLETFLDSVDSDFEKTTFFLTALVAKSDYLLSKEKTYYTENNISSLICTNDLAKRLYIWPNIDRSLQSKVNRLKVDLHCTIFRNFYPLKS